MTCHQIQRRRREICTQRDGVRRRLSEIRAFRVKLGQVESSRSEQRLFHRLLQLTDELVQLDARRDVAPAN